MRISTKLVLKDLLAIAIVMAMGGMLIVATRYVKAALHSADIASGIVDGTATLRFLAIEYLDSPSERAETQWSLKYKSLQDMIDAAGSEDPLEGPQLKNLSQQLSLLQEGYDRLVGSIAETSKPGRPHAYAPNEYAKKLASNLIVNTQSLIGNAATYREQSSARVESLLDRVQWLFLFIGIALGIILLTVMFVIMRDISRRLGRLRQGAEAIGLAQLGYRISHPSSDEIGAVEKSFNTMADRLESQRQELVAENASRAKAEQGLIRVNQAFEAANKELEAFAYSVSHDLRAPLRGMTGFSQILIEDFGPQLPSEARSYLSRIQAAGMRMGQLIDDMLTLSRISRGDLHLEIVDLSALAAEVLNELRKSEPERKVECAVADGLKVSGDARLLRILLVNILGNAWKFTGRAALPRLEFGTVPTDGGQAFYVRDNGAGFDMAYADKLFGAFQRLHTSDDFPGTGIGLAIAQRIVNRHGGRIWAEAGVGKGATFFFTV